MRANSADPVTVAVIANLCARKLRQQTGKGSMRTALHALARASRGRVEVIETGSLSELRQATARLAEKPPEVVVYAGGDGSYMAGLTALTDAYARAGRERLPKIALVPGGTVSTVARNWGFRGRFAGASKHDRSNHDRETRYALRLLEAITSGEAQLSDRPTLRVRGPDAERIGFIVGAGLVSSFFGLYEAEGANGYVGAARIVAKLFASSLVGGKLAEETLAPRPCAITVDGESAPFDSTSLFCASVVRNLGLGMRPTYRAAERHDRFHIIATPLRPTRLGPQMPRVMLGRPLHGPRVDTLASVVTLRFPEGQGLYVLDGEVLRGDVHVSPGPVLQVFALPG